MKHQYPDLRKLENSCTSETRRYGGILFVFRRVVHAATAQKSVMFNSLKINALFC